MSGPSYEELAALLNPKTVGQAEAERRFMRDASAIISQIHDIKKCMNVNNFTIVLPIGEWSDISHLYRPIAFHGAPIVFADVPKAMVAMPARMNVGPVESWADTSPIDASPRGHGEGVWLH
ncbi:MULTISPECIES: hypothetical protein [Nocardia]|uniref:hypothetical protein n=1 Tax=Nocardia TaxID=1817 RepID=UPI0013009B8E|nr:MULTISPECIES: hypothetical protein [Nocardia]